MQPKGGFDPNILAFDTTLSHCAAAFFNDFPRYEVTEPMTRGQGERLMPLLQEVLSHENGRWQDLDLIAVGVGPGNFTGIRISVAAARGLGLALGIGVMGVSMFEVMREPDGQWAEPSEVVSLPAPRGKAYLQHFRYGVARSAPTIIDPSAPPDDLQFPVNTKVVGYCAEALALAGHASHWDDVALTDVATRIARRAEARWLAGETAPERPAPLYVRPADAAPPRDAAPVILP